MKKTRWTLRLAWAVAALGTLLAGCTVNYYHADRCPQCTGMTSGTGDPAKPLVSADNGRIRVDQEVIRFGKDQVNVTITWRLPADGKLSFPANGIVFERAAAGEITDCKRGERPTEFTCVNRHSRPGVYQYGVNVNEGDTPLKPLDPHLVND